MTSFALRSVTVNPGGSLLNYSPSELLLGNNSRTVIGSATAKGGVVDLVGRNMTLTFGGQLVNNGLIYDSANSTSAPSVLTGYLNTVIKGEGTYALNAPIITVNGGQFQAGNGPGRATLSTFAFSGSTQSTGVSNYKFLISNAAGPAGPAPDANGRVSGYSLSDVHPVTYNGATYGTGNFAWTATPSSKLTFAIQTVADPAVAGDNPTGPMAGFNSTQSYQWTVLRFTGTYTGPIYSTRLILAQIRMFGNSA